MAVYKIDEYNQQGKALPSFNARNAWDLPTTGSDKISKSTQTSQGAGGKAPKSIERADRGRGEYEKDHVHFKDGSTLNFDGTWKHGGKELTRQEIKWLQSNGWNVS